MEPKILSELEKLLILLCHLFHLLCTQILYNASMASILRHFVRQQSTMTWCFSAKMKRGITPRRLLLSEVDALVIGLRTNSRFSNRARFVRCSFDLSNT